MAMALVRRARVSFARNVDPNVIPFIDVLLVLLIIFMVTAPKPTTDLRVDLPRPGPPVQLLIAPTMVQVRASPTGARIFLNSEEVSRARLPAAAMAHILASNTALAREDVLAEGKLFVRADLEVSYQDVISVVEDLQAAQFQRVSIVAQDADAP
jgi:biopolymer transport protein ExbD